MLLFDNLIENVNGAELAGLKTAHVFSPASVRAGLKSIADISVPSTAKSRKNSPTYEYFQPIYALNKSPPIPRY